MTTNRTQGGTYKCLDCGKTFATPRELREHEETCDARKPALESDQGVERKQAL